MAKNRERTSIFDTSDLTDPILQSLKEEDPASAPEPTCSQADAHTDAQADAHAEAHTDAQAEISPEKPSDVDVYTNLVPLADMSAPQESHACVDERTHEYADEQPQAYAHTEPYAVPRAPAGQRTAAPTYSYAGRRSSFATREKTYATPCASDCEDTREGETDCEEYKTERMYLLVRPSVAAKIKAAAKARRTSANDLIHWLMEQFLEENNM